jgi:hypothetical protein
MNHLTDEQLGALADGALTGAARTEAERHLEACAACREALAGLMAQDRDLRDVLGHDPGDAYFEDFAARVGGRLRAAGLRGAQARAPEGRGLADWFRSPRKLVAVAALATVVVGAGLVMLSTREVTLPALRSRGLERATELSAPPAPVPAPAPANEAGTSTALPAPPPAPAPAAPSPAAAPRAKGALAAREHDQAGSPRDETKAADEAPVPVSTSEVAVRSPAAGAQVEGLVETARTADTGPGVEVNASRSVAARAAPPEARTLSEKSQSEIPSYGGAASLDLSREPTYTEVHGRNAERLTSLAEAMRLAPAWDSAAEEWIAVLRGTERGRLELETRYQLARARYRAWSSGPTEKRAAKAAEAFTGFLRMAPAGAQRDSVSVWRRAVGVAAR